MIALAAPLLLAGGAGGALLLRRSWSARQPHPAYVPAGGALVVATLLAGALWIGPVKGLALATAAISVGGLAVVAAGRVTRRSRDARGVGLAPEPLDGPSRASRGWLKALLAGPLGMAAAMALAFCYATWVPGDPRTRLVVAGLLVPVLWGCAMTWTLADRKLWRTTAALAGTTMAGFALAAAGGLA